MYQSRIEFIIEYQSPLQEGNYCLKLRAPIMIGLHTHIRIKWFICAVTKGREVRKHFAVFNKVAQ